MDRREFITAGAVAFAGCLGGASSPESTTQQKSEPGSVHSETTSDSSVVLEYGEWYEAESLNVTATGMSPIEQLPTATTPNTDIPPDTKLLIISGKVENTTDSQLVLTEAVDLSLNVIAAGKLFHPLAAASSNTESGTVQISQIEVESGVHFTSSETDLSPGERVSVWQAALIPSHIPTDEAQTTMCRTDGGCGVRWKSGSKNCDCPG